MSRVGRDLVSAAPNDDAQKKCAVGSSRSGVLLGSGKRSWQCPICTVTGLGCTTDIKKN
jgi:hypothetical protein